MYSTSSILSNNISYNSMELTKEIGQIEKKDVSLSSSTSEINSIKEKNNLIKLKAYFTCTFCSKTSDLKLCKICQKIFCDDCLKKSEINKICKNCNKKTKYISIRYIDFLSAFVHSSFEMSFKIITLEGKKISINDKLNEKNCKKCLFHNEKILFYCFNCHKNLCGKCSAFFNQESKIHIGHNVKDCSYIQKLKYNLVIDDLENNEKNIDKINEIIKNLKLKKNENKLKKENLEKMLNEFITKINDYYEKENEKINKFISKLNKLKIEIEKMCKIVYDEFKDAKKFGKINVREKTEELRYLSQTFFNFQKKSEKIIKLKTLIDFKTFNFSFIMNYNNMEEPDKFEVKEPFTFNIFVKKNNGNIIISMPFEIEITDESQKKLGKRYKLIPKLLVNGKFYSNFEIKKIEKNNNISRNKIEETELIQAISDGSDSSSYSIIETKSNNSILSGDNIIFSQDENLSNIKNYEMDTYYEYKFNTNLEKSKKESNEFDLIIHSYSIQSLYN